jgi:hypothetical protein
MAWPIFADVQAAGNKFYLKISPPVQGTNFARAGFSL